MNERDHLKDLDERTLRGRIKNWHQENCGRQQLIEVYEKELLARGLSSETARAVPNIES